MKTGLLRSKVILGISSHPDRVLLVLIPFETPTPPLAGPHLLFRQLLLPPRDFTTYPELIWVRTQTSFAWLFYKRQKTAGATVAEISIFLSCKDEACAILKVAGRKAPILLYLS
jgi:hypothetical protein